MGTEWLANFTSINMCYQKFEIREAMHDIPYPRLELGIHATMETTQLGTLAGSMVYAPLSVLYKANRLNLRATRFSMLNAFKRYGMWGFMGGLVAGPFWNWYKWQINFASDEELIQRCYELRHDAVILHRDRFVTLASIIGLSFGRIGGFIGSHNLAWVMSHLYELFCSRFAYKKYVRLPNVWEEDED